MKYDKLYKLYSVFYKNSLVSSYTKKAAAEARAKELNEKKGFLE